MFGIFKPLSRPAKIALILLSLSGSWLAGGYKIFGFSSPIPPFAIKEKQAIVYLRQGVRQLYHNRFHAARESFYESLNIYPDFHLARRFLGDSYYLSGDWDSAIREWETLYTQGYEKYILRSKIEAIRFTGTNSQMPQVLSFYKSLDGRAERSYRFQNPVDVLLDKQNNLYILSYGSANLIKISPSGKFLENFRSADESFEGPISMTSCKSYLFIADYKKDLIHKMDFNGHSYKGFGKSGSEKAAFHGPSSINCYASELYVSDSENNRIQKFNIDGKLLSVFSTKSEDKHILENPLGIAVNEKNIFVVNGQQNSIMVFDQYFNYQKTLKGKWLKKPRALKIYNNYLFIADEKQGIIIYNLEQAGWKLQKTVKQEKENTVYYRRAFNMAMDYNGLLYTADFSSNSVNIFFPERLRTTNLDVSIEKVNYDSFPTVGVYISVKNRNNQFIKGLDRSNFILRENGTRVTGISSHYLQKFKQDHNILLLNEQSYRMKRFKKSYRYVLKGLLDPLLENDKISVMGAGKDIINYQNFVSSRLKTIYSLEESVFEEKEKAFIQIGKAMYSGIQNLLPYKGHRALIFLSSGHKLPGAFNQYPIEIIKNFSLTHDVPVYVIFFEESNNPEDKEYRESISTLCRETGGQAFYAFHSANLKDIYTIIDKQLDNRYVLAFNSRVDRKEQENQFSELRVEVNYKGQSGIWNGGYFIPAE